MERTIEYKEFAAMVADALLHRGQFDGELVHDDNDFRLHIKDGQGRITSTIFLGNFYREFCAAQDDETRVQIIARATNINLPDVGELNDLEAVRADLMPLIRPRWVITDQQIRLNLGRVQGPEQPPFLSHLAFAGVFAIVIVKDLPDRFAILNSQNFDEMGITLDEATDIAFTNLAMRTPNLEAESFPDESGGYHVHVFCDIQDGYMTTRVLLDELVAQFPVKGDPVYALIGDEYFVLTGSDDDVGLGMLLVQMEHGQDLPKPLPPIAIRYSQDVGYTVYMPDFDHPLYDAFNRLKSEYWASIYEDQAALIDGTYEVLQNNYAIGDYAVWENDTGSVITVCPIEQEMVPILLPQAEYLQFFRGDEELAIVPWYHAAEILGAELQDPDPGENWRFPNRYLLKNFPTEEQLQQIIALMPPHEES
jgi:hypothetical protein